MMDDLQTFLDSRADAYRSLFVEFQDAAWQAARTGSKDALQRQARGEQAILEFESDPDSFSVLRHWDGIALDNSLQARQVRVMRLRAEMYQLDARVVAEIAELNRVVNELFINFRGEIGGQRFSANEIKAILVNEVDSELRRKAWEASKQIGVQVAEPIRQLARLRSQAARKAGYRNYHSMALTLAEIDERDLFELLDRLFDLTVEPFGQAKATVDKELAQRFGIARDQLMPWHYADPFFQEAPPTDASHFDGFFAGKDLERLALETFGELGMDVQEILKHSDLYERNNKYQHAACFDMDREGDVRVICNLQNTLEWMDSLLHELGHAVSYKFTDYNLPWMLRGCNHIITSEAIAILAGRLPLTYEWLTTVLGLEEGTVRDILPHAQAHRRLQRLILARWIMVVVNFERALYIDPDQDLDMLWWGLVEKYQLVRRPSRRKEPDWAAKIHIGLYPVYYQNYLLGELMSYQWENHLNQQFGGIVGRPEAGKWLIDHVFRRGNREDWNTALRIATGSKLNPAYYLEHA